MGLKDLPLGRAPEIKRAFERRGWSEAARKSNHILLVKPGERATLAIPNHRGRDVKRALLKALIDAAGMTEEEFLLAYRGK